MLATAQGVVTAINKVRAGLTVVEVELKSGQQRQAINYDSLIGELELGNRVILNTTAVDLGLGTGGYDFVIAAVDAKPQSLQGPGHIMKLRYTPLQLKVEAVEEKSSAWRKEIADFSSLEEQLVLVGSLHSMVAPAALILANLSREQLKVVYIMTDKAALPLQLSHSIVELKEAGLIQSTITVGQAFGGDLEAVNIYSGLIAAKEVLQADVVIVAMGPGIVGTGTEYGFTGLEQGQIINAVNVLGGTPIAIPRISFADSRERHYGLSHHTLTALSKVALTEAIVALPKLSGIQKTRIEEQLATHQLINKHQLRYKEGAEILEIINEARIAVNTMGRDEKEDPEFFKTAGIAALLALEELGLLIRS
ncbi:DUF3866 family protein [Fuchsiella alkaliacetigena]|uniref:DUF3866 family protein n=1 Tax=Fuchsiella alkaliacetigena TaxID=957042 RepID=UPI00200A40A0|nr:DUF3866 family protein [Fuchsiella alkaliacetigena]MCK8824753.1 DUF3866 family protein [Fuchsiella alkaliacetigena]